jgi:regulatory protein
MNDDSRADSSDMIRSMTIPNPPSARPRGTARGAAVRLLGRRDHASGELREKLLRKGFPSEEVEEAVRSLAASGYLDDAKWAAAFARRHLAQGRGWHWVRARILRAGAPPPPAPTREEEAGQALALLGRRRVDARTLTDLGEKARIIRFLRGRGYRTAAISLALGPGLDEETED